MNRSRLRLGGLALACALTACAPAPQAPVTSPAPSAVMPSPGASPAASPASSAAPATTAPSVAPTASAAPASEAPATTSPGAAALDLTKGRLLRRYDFEGIGGLEYDFSRDQFWVLDGEDEDETPRRYLARRFKRDGTLDAVIDLHAEDEDAPEAVQGFAFDLAGVPVFTYMDDEAFSLRRLYTATVEPASRLPNAELERAGLAALAAEGNVFSLGVVRLDPDVDEFDTKDRQILYFRAEEDQDPEAIFRIPDPLEPTNRMAMTPAGALYLFGGVPGVGLRVKRLDKTQAISDVPIPLTRMPDHVWVAPNGDLLLADETTGNVPARIRRFTGEGVLVGESEVKLADGSPVYAIGGLTFDARGKIFVAGTALAADLTTSTGLFTFD